MSLNLTKESTGDGIPVFQKFFELFTGGFSLTITGFNTGEILPKGSLLKVDEAARTAVPIKTAKVVAGGGGTDDIIVESGHHFQVGDVIALTVGAKAYTIDGITATADGDIISVATAIDTATAGDVLFESSANGATHAAYETVANTLSFHDVMIESGATVTAIRRGTAFKNRIQAHTAGLIADIPATVQLSQSY